MKRAKKILTATLDVILFLLGIDGKMRRNAVDEGLLDFSGQGRDKYGR